MTAEATLTSASSASSASSAKKKKAAARLDLSLVFPVFDEERTIGTVIETALAAAEKLTHAFEIVVVDDGSKDGSAAIIDLWRSRDERVHLVRHSANTGYGAALRSGLREATG